MDRLQNSNLNLPYQKPIFTDLINDDLLQKCLHGTTQNNNEALNGLIWKKVPKDVFVGHNVLEIGVCALQ